MSGDGVTRLSNGFSRPERGRTEKSLMEIHLVILVLVFQRLRRRLVAAPLSLTEAPLRQPLRRYQGPVTNHLALTGGVEISH